MRVETQAQANKLNQTGEYGPYLAANGHRMIANLRFPKNETEDSTGEREYQIGDEIRYSTFDAWCASDCRACSEGYDLPDW